MKAELFSELDRIRVISKRFFNPQHNDVSDDVLGRDGA